MTLLSNSTTTQQIAAWSSKVAEAVEQAERLEPETKTVKCFRLSKSPEGEFQLSPRPDFTGTVDAICDRPGRFGNVKPDAELVAELFEKGDAYFKIRDADAWESLRLWAEQVNPQPEECRVVSRLMSVLLVLRAGITRGGTLSALDIEYGAGG